jgi:hypothetical protein
MLNDFLNAISRLLILFFVFALSGPVDETTVTLFNKPIAFFC